MSLKVKPLLAYQGEARPLHFVPEGRIHCVLCGVDKFRQNFHYTDEPTFVTAYADQEGFGMIDTGDHTVRPYSWCSPRTEGGGLYEFSTTQH